MTIVSTLRAMAHNYADGHQWDHLDGEAVTKAADRIVALETGKGVFDPIPMILTCPSCGARHIDEGVFATKPHHTHACQGCGIVWRPAKVDTVGVQFLPGYKN